LALNKTGELLKQGSTSAGFTVSDVSESSRDLGTHTIFDGKKGKPQINYCRETEITIFT
jgi:hypothetical protein